jgi:hypothetical protein
VTAEPLTPLSVEAKLRQLVNDLTRTPIMLREARDAEVDARHDYDRARRRALLSDKSPKVTRGGYTVAEQAAWVDEQCADLKFASAKVTKVSRSRPAETRTASRQAADADPWASDSPGGYSDEPPF